MRKHGHLVITAFSLSGLLIGCSPGGGGGRYYSPAIALNPYRIERQSFERPPDGLTERQDLSAKLPFDSTDDRYVQGKKYYYFRRINFQGAAYTLAIPLDNSIAILDSEGKFVAELRTPRYSCNAAAVELTNSTSSSILAILIAQQSSSHSSTLYMLDSRLKPIYKEHLLGAKWIAKGPSADGNTLYVSTEDRWLQHGEWEVLGGNWMYDVFDGILDKNKAK